MAAAGLPRGAGEAAKGGGWGVTAAAHPGEETADSAPPSPDLAIPWLDPTGVGVLAAEEAAARRCDKSGDAGAMRRRRWRRRDVGSGGGGDDAPTTMLAQLLAAATAARRDARGRRSSHRRAWRQRGVGIS
uniref:DUF834 domain-containing protein n=1 Tax=Oryza meridionalis TaxID=40149 RepID=A0A0E0EE77_9ORYZ